MIVYAVVESDFDGTSILGSYSKKSDAEVHLALENEQANLKDYPDYNFEIQELEVSSEAPRLFYAHKIDSKGSSPSSVVRIGVSLPETFVADKPMDPHMGYPQVEAYGWTPQEACLKAEMALHSRD